MPGSSLAGRRGAVTSTYGDRARESHSEGSAAGLVKRCDRQLDIWRKAGCAGLTGRRVERSGSRRHPKWPKTEKGGSAPKCEHE
jgi:hypothetical protein